MRKTLLLLFVGMALSSTALASDSDSDPTDISLSDTDADIGPLPSSDLENEVRTPKIPADSDDDVDSETLNLIFKDGVAKDKIKCRHLKGLSIRGAPGSDNGKSDNGNRNLGFAAGLSKRGKKVSATVQDILNDCSDEVAAAAPNGRFYISGRPLSGSAPRRSLLQTAASNDPYLSQQWGLPAIDAINAWKTSKGDVSAPVCVVDTGVQLSHPEITKQLLRNTLELSNSIDDDLNGWVDDLLIARSITGIPNVQSTIKRDGTGGDDNGHGTHVAGIIGALTNNTAGIAGVAPSTKLLVCKAMNSTGSGYLSDIVSCFDWCNKRGAKIVNNAFGSCVGDQQYWIDYMTNVFASYPNMLFVQAAGNSGVNLTEQPACGFPAIIDAPNMISVGAISTSYSRFSTSNYSKKLVDVGAPGVNIISTYTGSAYQIMQGTSMASGFVSGSAAILKAANPLWTPQTLKNALMSSCTQTADGSWNTCGGYINVKKALSYVPPLLVI